MSAPASRPGTTGTTRATGAIHNIGYRHYDGPRLGRFDVIRALYSTTLRGSYGIGRGMVAKLFPWFLAACAVLPAFILVAVQSQEGEKLIDLNQYTIFVQLVPALFLAVQAPQAVSRDLRFNVLPLYFSRPLTYHDYVLARFAGVWTGLFALLVTPLLLLYVGGLLIEVPLGDLTLELLASVLAVALLGVLLTSIGLLVASVTPRRGLGVAAIIAVLAVSYGAASAMQGIVAIASSADAAVWAGLLSPQTIYDMMQSGLFGFAPTGPVTTPGFGVGLVFLAVLLGVSALCYRLLVLRYRKASST